MSVLTEQSRIEGWVQELTRHAVTLTRARSSLITGHHLTLLWLVDHSSTSCLQEIVSIQSQSHNIWSVSFPHCTVTLGNSHRSLLGRLWGMLPYELCLCSRVFPLENSVFKDPSFIFLFLFFIGYKESIFSGQLWHSWFFKLKKKSPLKPHVSSL